MRRKDREVADLEGQLAILEQCPVCRVAINDPASGVPYLVPLNFGMAAGPQNLTLYFHCAPVGTKLDLLRADPNVSFEAVCPGTVSGGATSCTYGMNYQSVIGRGTVRFVEGGEKLTALQAHLAAWVDFPEEDVPELDPAHLRTVLGAVREELDALIRSYDAGAVLREGVDCAIVGRPNAGKSTLLNLLAGFDRAIVTPVAGTTRDVVEQAVQLGDIRLNLFDTAGLRETEDAIEAEGIRRSWRKLDEAGLVLAVFDAAQTLSDDDLELARRCQGRPAIAVLNKQDLAGETDVPRGTLEPYFKKIVPMCARDAVGLQALTDAVADLLGTAQLDPEAAQLCSARQLAAATRARDALAEAIAARQNGFGLDAAAVCLTDALQALFDLTGENASDATIEEVFETFCVGK